VRSTSMRDMPMRNTPMRQWSMGDSRYERHAYEMAYGRGTHMRDARL
jgi:hypothetical protein